MQLYLSNCRFWFSQKCKTHFSRYIVVVVVDFLQGVRLAKYFETLVRSEAMFEIPVDCNLSLVVFRLKVSNLTK